MSRRTKIKEIDISRATGNVASKWGLADFYRDSYDALCIAISSGEEFETDWFGCQKEIIYGKYTKANNVFKIEVACHMDDFWESNDLIYDALLSSCELEIELPDEIINIIRKEVNFTQEQTRVESYLPFDATIDDVIAETQVLEGKCKMANEEMFDQLCKIVRNQVEHFCKIVRNQVEHWERRTMKGSRYFEAEKKRVWIIRGTLNKDDYPDFEIFGVFYDQDEAIDETIALARQAFDGLDVPANHRTCEYKLDGGMSIIDDWDWSVELHCESWIIT